MNAFNGKWNAKNFRVHFGDFVTLVDFMSLGGFENGARVKDSTAYFQWRLTLQNTQV